MVRAAAHVQDDLAGADGLEHADHLGVAQARHALAVHSEDLVAWEGQENAGFITVALSYLWSIDLMRDEVKPMELWSFRAGVDILTFCAHK